ncbi:unnamed protein product, partial [Prorocentrum cordatum]
MEAILAQLPAALSAATVPLMEKYEERFNQQLRRVDGEVHAQRARSDLLDSTVAGIAHRLSHLEKELDLAKAKPRPPVVPNPEWDREVDLSILTVRASSAVAKNAVAAALAPWLTEANVPLGDGVELHGDDVAKSFTLAFQGPMEATRTSRRSQAQQQLRLPNGAWRAFRVDVGTESVPIHVSADKNKKMVATEIACKKLQRGLTDRGIRTFLDKDNGQLLAKWEPLVRVLPLPASRTPKVEWNLPALADAGLSRDEANELARQVFDTRFSPAKSQPHGHMLSAFGIVGDNCGHMYFTFWAMFSESDPFLGVVSFIFSPVCSLPQYCVDGRASRPGDSSWLKIFRDMTELASE